MFAHVQTLIKLRKEEKLLANGGTFSFLSHSDEDVCIAYSKKDENKTIVVILNPSSEEASHPLPFNLKGKKLTDLLKGSEFAAESEQLSVTVAPFGFEIISF
jgi:cyclomaltodextrinase / maltogenic alpha-amylase / neopullulanase